MKKNLLTVLILALLVVNLVLTTIMMVSVLSANKKTSELVTTIAAALTLELAAPGSSDAAETQVSLADTETHSLGEQMIPVFNAEGKQVYMIFEVSFSMNTKGDGYKKLGEKVSAGDYDDLIADRVNSIVSSHTAEECQTNFEPIRAEILAAVQDLIGPFVYRINISGIKFG